MADFLLEIGVEEIPVSEVLPVIGQLDRQFQKQLKEKRIQFGSIETCATNRRLMLYISDISLKAEDYTETKTGPAKRIAFNDNGEPAVPLVKFAESNDIEIRELYEIDTPRGVYMGFEKLSVGEATEKILETLIPEILKKLSFKKAMVWNDSRTFFVRPIKNILALLDNSLVNFEFAGIESSRVIDAHSLLSEENLEISSYRDYIEKLQQNFVIPSIKEREKIILQDIMNLAADLNTQINIEPDMLHYYVFNNEYPVVFSGNFDRKYLELPAEIISEFMKNEKKLHPVYDPQGNLLNTFVGVSNIPDENHNVSKGNEKVIQATFEDAAFFWDKDREEDFHAMRSELEKVLFHKGIGSYFEKSLRLEKLTGFICALTDHEESGENLARAARFCKNDLVTRMVGEFPSLQGIMGGLYLRESGEPQHVWQTVYGHYAPRGFTGDRLTDVTSGILSLADKMDNVCAFISQGIKSSSSSDPYGIRRDANAIIKLIFDLELDFDLGILIEEACASFRENVKVENLTEKVTGMFALRLNNILREQFSVRHDVVDAVLCNSGLTILGNIRRCLEISRMTGSQAMQQLVILHKRLKNISKKKSEAKVDPKYFTEDEERILFEISSQASVRIREKIAAGDYPAACSEILELKPVIDNFFDHVLVMDKDAQIRENRTALIRDLDDLIDSVADFSMISDSELENQDS